MSEVLIRMKMPQCCEECRFFAWKRGVGQHCAVDDRITFHATLDGFDVGYERNGECPLVPVLPHGDLIERDELPISTAVPLDGKPYQYVHIDNIKGAPTIIPAEEEN